MTPPRAPYVLDDGDWIANSDDGKRAKRLRPGSEPGEGWHVMTQAEFEAKVDSIVAEAVASDPVLAGKVRRFLGETGRLN